jgi:hypothetical protein
MQLVEGRKAKAKRPQYKRVRSYINQSSGRGFDSRRLHFSTVFTNQNPQWIKFSQKRLLGKAVEYPSASPVSAKNLLGLVP